MKKIEMEALLEEYKYPLPPELISNKPASPRDSSKLFVYDTANDKITIDKFVNIDKYLPADSFLVMNQTKVLPVRVLCKDEQNEDVELLVLTNEIFPKDKYVKAIGSRKIHPGEKIFINKKYYLELFNSDQKVFLFKPNFEINKLKEILLRFGKTPIPSYIENHKLQEKELRKRYQSIFAKNPGSTAAPTASLHFTNRVFKKLDSKKIQRLFVTLHVGLGTFSTLLPEHFEENKLFEEHYEIDKKTADKITKLKKNKKLIAVGTTSVRTLESFTRNKKLRGGTDIFIHPPFDFKTVDCLITNFHVPKSSLMLLVESFLQHKKSKRRLKELYMTAIEKEFRFYSFGDSMLII